MICNTFQYIQNAYERVYMRGMLEKMSEDQWNTADTILLQLTLSI